MNVYIYISIDFAWRNATSQQMVTLSDKGRLLPWEPK